jgi:hypothetical protein
MLKGGIYGERFDNCYRCYIALNLFSLDSQEENPDKPIYAFSDWTKDEGIFTFGKDFRKEKEY